MRNKKLYTALAAVAAVVLLSASSCENEATNADKAITNESLVNMQQAQPVPVFSWSQERATLISLLTARATTTATTSFFYNQGVEKPVGFCPSVGFPLASTAQLTNPVQVTGSSGAVIDQAEPTAVYTGDSTGTYVVCVSSKGIQYPFYWEGFVGAVGGQASLVNGEIVLEGEPTVVVPQR